MDLSRALLLSLLAVSLLGGLHAASTSREDEEVLQDADAALDSDRPVSYKVGTQISFLKNRG
jgi:hypothetical protein